MKILDKLISFIFSIIILVLAITVILVNMGYVNADKIYSILHQYAFSEEIRQTALITATVCALAALKVTIFSSSFKSKSKEPIFVETNHGMIEISQDTIENTVRSVAGEFPEIKEVQAKMLKKKKGVKIYAIISVLANTNIRALTGELQERVEEVIDETTGIKTLSTNIKVKNIYDKAKKTNKPEAKPNQNVKTTVEKNTTEKKVVEIKEPVKEETKEVVKEEKIEENVSTEDEQIELRENNEEVKE